MRRLALLIALSSPVVVAHARVADADEDGLTDLDELRLGTDPHDFDTDGDGLPDGMEVEDLVEPEDHDEDGVIDALDDDDDDDDIPTLHELGDWHHTQRGLAVPDADRDGTPDHLDEDSDDDGHPDQVEGGGDMDADGLPNHVDPDADGDGLYDVNEQPGDTDGDGHPDVLDLDDDGDGISTPWEYAQVRAAASDLDGDGVPPWLDTDSDGDGIADGEEGIEDDDCDSHPNFLDARDDDGPCHMDFQPTPAQQSGPSGCATSPAPTAGWILGLGLLALGFRRRG